MTSPAGPNQAIQFNNSGVFGGSASFVYDDATTSVTLGSQTTAARYKTPNGTGGNPGVDLRFETGDADQSGDNNGGAAIFEMGDGAGTGAPGTFQILFPSGTSLVVSRLSFNFNASTNNFIGFTSANFNNGATAQAGAFFTNDVDDSITIAITSDAGGTPPLNDGPVACAYVTTSRQFLVFGAQGGTGGAAFMADNDQNTIVGLKTNATTDGVGFLYVPRVSGAQTGIPNFLTGLYANSTPLRFDSTNGRLYAYYGGAWHFAQFV